ncbi:MAG TPA: nucleoside-diphosphate kinase [Candidatus Saccharimonadales bacterium]|nr:nucleoside-diphosphate kinase [Candidatus Saccharimonadales bacterium]
MHERTLIILKPDAIQRGLIGDIISRFEKIGLKIIGAKFFIPTEELLNKHYPLERREFIEGMGGKTLSNYKETGLDPLHDFGTDDPYEIGKVVQKWLVDFMVSAPVFAVVLEGPHAIDIVRKVRGHTLPLKAEVGTITGDLSFDSSALANTERRPIRNLVHASGSREEADFEIGLWFDKDELFDYETPHLPKK